MAVIYTLGYEGIPVEQLLNILKDKQIKTLIDVRNNPFSRKIGFSKKALKEKCAQSGIEYYHFPQIGIPSAIRQKITDKKSLWMNYTQEILPKADKTVNEISLLLKTSPSALLCFEKNQQNCHRHLLAKKISSITNLPVKHSHTEKALWE